ncbi:MAG: energy transducer TonB [Acidobacteria bacterium]|nr:energy transducer TonB [Acidobacteriota bacterium]
MRYAFKSQIWWAAILLLAMGAFPCRADIKLTEVQAKAAATQKPLPEYPAMARQLKVTGKVELEVVIAPNGSVEDVKIVSGNPILTRCCAKVVHGWSFTPVLENGKPARATAPLSFEFR